MQNIISILNKLNNFYNSFITETSISNDPKRFFDVDATEIEIKKFTTIEQCEEVMNKIKAISISFTLKYVRIQNCWKKLKIISRTSYYFQKVVAKVREQHTLCSVMISYHPLKLKSKILHYSVKCISNNVFFYLGLFKVKQ